MYTILLTEKPMDESGSDREPPGNTIPGPAKKIHVEEVVNVHIEFTCG